MREEKNKAHEIAPDEDNGLPIASMSRVLFGPIRLG
jgi:hypothetical protein